MQEGESEGEWNLESQKLGSSSRDHSTSRKRLTGSSVWLRLAIGHTGTEHIIVLPGAACLMTIEANPHGA